MYAFCQPHMYRHRPTVQNHLKRQSIAFALRELSPPMHLPSLPVFKKATGGRASGSAFPSSVGVEPP
jgi:hypothetical protein